MTPDAWNALSDEQKAALREMFRAERQAVYGPQRGRDWAKDIWIARDQYRVENFLLGCLALPLVGLLIAGVIAAGQLIHWMVGQ